MSDDERDGIAPDEELHLLRGAQLPWIHSLAERLVESGVPCQVNPMDERRASDSTWAVYVREGDLARARAIDALVMREVMPDLPDDFDPAALDTSRCPACSEPILEGMAECPECGLALL